jgi:hypothetical protein
MERFYAELSDAEAVAQAFVDSYREDLDGEGTEREDLALAAEARLRVWRPQGDAVLCAWTLFEWLIGQVLPVVFPDVELPSVDGLDDAAAVRATLEPHVTVALDAWHELAEHNEDPADREWAVYQALDHARYAAQSLSWLPRRMSPTKYKAKLRSGDTPLDLCVRVGGCCAGAHVYLTQLEPRLADAFRRLAIDDYADAGVERRAREALHDAGIIEFGKTLEAYARRIVEAYDRAASVQRPTLATAAEAAERALPTDRHQAVVMVAESSQLSDRPIPKDAQTYVDAAWDVVERAGGEVAARVHAMAGRR